MKLLDHPHVVKLYDVLETSHRTYLARGALCCLAFCINGGHGADGAPVTARDRINDLFFVWPRQILEHVPDGDLFDYIVSANGDCGLLAQSLAHGVRNRRPGPAHKFEIAVPNGSSRGVLPRVLRVSP